MLWNAQTGQDTLKPWFLKSRFYIFDCSNYVILAALHIFECFWLEKRLPLTSKVRFLHNSKDKCLNSSVFRTDVQHKHRAEFAYTRARADSLSSFLRLTDTLPKCRSGLWVKTVRMQECWHSYMWANVPFANPEVPCQVFWITHTFVFQLEHDLNLLTQTSGSSFHLTNQF